LFWQITNLTTSYREYRALLAVDQFPLAKENYLFAPASQVTVEPSKCVQSIADQMPIISQAIEQQLNTTQFSSICVAAANSGITLIQVCKYHQNTTSIPSVFD
jgi:hypothetical protein